MVPEKGRKTVVVVVVVD